MSEITLIKDGKAVRVEIYPQIGRQTVKAIPEYKYYGLSRYWKKLTPKAKEEIRNTLVGRYITDIAYKNIVSKIGYLNFKVIWDEKTKKVLDVVFPKSKKQ